MFVNVHSDFVFSLAIIELCTCFLSCDQKDILSLRCQHYDIWM